MKRMGIFGLALMAAGVLWADEPTIALNRVQQRYPWNGMVDIDYTVADVPAGSEAKYYVRFKISENGNTHVLHSMLDISTLCEASNGTYRVTWNSAWEGTEYHFYTKNANIQAELVYCGDDKSDLPYGDQYMIIDLTAGTTEAADVAKTYPVSYCNLTFDMATNRFNTTEYKTNKLVLRRVKAGTFIMGSPVGEYGREPEWRTNKETQHQVTLTQDFLLGVFEVTQGQYFRVMGTKPSGSNNGDNDYPVEQVSYQNIRGSSTGCAVPPTFGNFDTDSFMQRISRRTGLTFDLPTEAQWEYACRAGTTNNTYVGTVTTSPNNITASVAWYSDNGSGTTHPVGQKLPNAWGFYDMLGNVFEWCRDRVASNDDWGTAAVTDPLRGVNGEVTSRGGCWNYDARYTRAACRFGYCGVSSAYRDFGFRLSRTLP